MSSLSTSTPSQKRANDCHQCHLELTTGFYGYSSIPWLGSSISAEHIVYLLPSWSRSMGTEESCKSAICCTHHSAPSIPFWFTPIKWDQASFTFLLSGLHHYWWLLPPVGSVGWFGILINVTIYIYIYTYLAQKRSRKNKKTHSQNSIWWDQICSQLITNTGMQLVSKPNIKVSQKKTGQQTVEVVGEPYT